MIDQLRQMAIFAKVIDHGSFRGAAKDLRLSPSVVSHHISMLEDRLGFALMHRTTRKLALTQEGERLLAATQKMLEVVEDELTKLSLSVGEPSGLIRVTAPAVLSQSRLTKSLAYFSVLYPRINLSLDFSDRRRDLIEDGYDLAIRISTHGKAGPNTKALFSIKRRLVASTSYLSRQPQIRDPDQLGSLDWLTLHQVQNKPVTLSKGTKKVTIRPNVRMISNDAYSLYLLSAGGAGLAIVPDFLVGKGLGADRIQTVLPEWLLSDLEVFAETPANAQQKPALIQLLLQHLAKANLEAVRPV